VTEKAVAPVNRSDGFYFNKITAVITIQRNWQQKRPIRTYRPSCQTIQNLPPFASQRLAASSESPCTDYIISLIFQKIYVSAFIFLIYSLAQRVELQNYKFDN